MSYWDYEDGYERNQGSTVECGVCGCYIGWTAGYHAPINCSSCDEMEKRCEFRAKQKGEVKAKWKRKKKRDDPRCLHCNRVIGKWRFIKELYPTCYSGICSERPPEVKHCDHCGRFRNFIYQGKGPRPDGTWLYWKCKTCGEWDLKSGSKFKCNYCYKELPPKAGGYRFYYEQICEQCRIPIWR